MVKVSGKRAVKGNSDPCRLSDDSNVAGAKLHSAEGSRWRWSLVGLVQVLIGSFGTLLNHPTPTPALKGFTVAGVSRVHAPVFVAHETVSVAIVISLARSITPSRFWRLAGGDRGRCRWPDVDPLSDSRRRDDTTQGSERVVGGARRDAPKEHVQPREGAAAVQAVHRHRRRAMHRSKGFPSVWVDAVTTSSPTLGFVHEHWAVAKRLGFRGRLALGFRVCVE